MMFDAWCEGCNNHIGQGTRFNSIKYKVGDYMNTPIFEFSMKCHLCPQKFIIRTNPKENNYDFVSGIRKKVKDYDAKDAETVEIDEDKQFALRNDRMMSLEQVKDDFERSQDNVNIVDRLIELRKEQGDSSKLNRKARDILREDRKKRKKLEEEKQRYGLTIDLLSSEDVGLPEPKHLKTHIKPIIPASRKPLIDPDNIKTKKIEDLYSKAIEGGIKPKNFTIKKEEKVVDELKVHTKVKNKEKKKQKNSLFSYAK